MSKALARFVARELDAPVPMQISAVAALLAARLDGIAVLFYGSALRTGDLDGVLDFYVLTDRPYGSLLRRAGMRWLWPDVSFHEVVLGGTVLRAKAAAMPIGLFARAARGAYVDTTIWTRFVQSSALIWCADLDVVDCLHRAVADAAITAGRFAAVLGPERGPAQDYWRALFRETYRAEMRIEPPGREQDILMGDPARYAALLPLAWEAGGIGFMEDGAAIVPLIKPHVHRSIARAWHARAWSGRALNLARLIKAAFTFEGAARYGLWKIRRHTGVDLALTPWRERHPVLAAPGVLWRVMRARGH
jgi:hypothetical protein